MALKAGWIVAWLFALAVQAGLMVVLAPWFAGLCERLAGRVSGRQRFHAGAGWPEIHHQARRPVLRGPADALNGVFCFSALVLAVLACGLVPVFALTPPGFPAPGLLLVCCVLVVAMLLLDLPLAVQGGLGAYPGSAALLGNALLLPVLCPVMLLAGTQDLSTFLAGLAPLSPLRDGAPYVLAGVALFVVTALSAQGAEREAVAAPLAGPDRAMWLLAADCVQLCWVSLAADVAWSASLAGVPGQNGGGAGGQGVGPWLLQCAEGAGLWLGKLVVAAVILALGRLVVLPALRRIRIRLGVVFLLGALAWQVTWALAPQPVMQESEGAAPVPAASDRVPDGQGGLS
ncbi:hypothetical protein K2X14_01285 [Acetobacter sp. TBRC 12305]|uniref:Uncharacterized protein n=1 Tax=Acetobacter garciniae TaxID=2817435 RepID=A0A939KQL3_9PROT|nr:hypothetical protein [Acetobacter garciniae]MBO1323786.1 hypothetical protein [Acetobacter garciniae]MBX0343475.1 hypothetical protein [Acetobacter garciniae]